VDDPDKEWLRQENQKLQDDIDSMHIVMDQVRNSLEAKEQQLEDLGIVGILFIFVTNPIPCSFLRPAY
jgi:hypothetical protein